MNRTSVECVELHHLIDTVYPANLLVKNLQIGNSDHNFAKAPSSGFLEAYGLDEERLEEIEWDILRKFDESSSFLATL
ncbi:MAG TPA: hypothetical protein DCX67_11170 [Opitutae bacterium]|nr:hypothetical protein [Opitutae bacterium]|tara:strand:- start:1058 stop:1291 length:234 start_codon:yes stop_codon:yes gene_type:complete